MKENENILAIPSKGKFKDESLNLLRESGIPIDITERQLSTDMELPDIGKFTIGLLRPKDIVKMVAAGEIPLGIVGEDTQEEYRLSWKGGNPVFNPNVTEELLPLGIGRCRLVLAALKDSQLEPERAFSPMSYWKFYKQFDGLTIATSYPNLTLGFTNGLIANDYSGTWPNFSLLQVEGSVEAYPALGKADAISDLIESGKTQEENKLRELMQVFSSEAVLITNNQNKKGDNPFVDKVRDRIFAALLKRGNPDAITRQRRIALIR